MKEWSCSPVKDCRLEVIERMSVFPCKNQEPIIQQVKQSERGRCSKCPGFSYVVPEEYRAHCKSDWHIFNLRQKDESDRLSFSQWSLEVVMVSSSSSSSESSLSAHGEINASPPALILKGIPFKILIENCLAMPSAVDSPQTLLNATFFAVLLLRAGRFAGAVWDSSGSVIAHTCFKRYTVRRKNGGSQSKNDQSKGRLANSAGAQIRRAEEQKLSEEVNELIQVQWKRFLDDPLCVVFAYASKSLSNSLMVGPLEKSRRKCTVLSVPLSVGDPTYAEVCRVYGSLVCFARR